MMPAPPKVSRAPARQPGPGERARPRLELVAPAPRLRISRRLALGALGAGFALLLMALVALHVVIAQEQFRLDGLQVKASNEQAAYEKLRLAVAQLESPARIVSVAEGSLGMRQPASVTYLPALRSPGAGTGTAAGGPAPAAVSSGPGTQAAPNGDADWPSIKPYLSGSP